MSSKDFLRILVLIVTTFGFWGQAASPTRAQTAPETTGVAPGAHPLTSPGVPRNDSLQLQAVQPTLTVAIYHLCDDYMRKNYPTQCPGVQGSRMLNNGSAWLCSASDPRPAWFTDPTLTNWNYGCNGDTYQPYPFPDNPHEDLPIEEYVRDVVPNETPIFYFSDLTELYKAQSIAARTYALQTTMWGQNTIWNSANYQVYIPLSGLLSVNGDIADAVSSTQGQVLFHPGATHPHSSTVFAEFSSDNIDSDESHYWPDPMRTEWTKPGSDDSLQPVYSPDGKDPNGHGHGLSQWGMCRWLKGNAVEKYDSCTWNTRYADSIIPTAFPPGGAYPVPFRPRWTNYRQLLAHYYTNVDLVDNYGEGSKVVPDFRWNVIEMHVPDALPALSETAYGQEVPSDWASGYNNATLLIQNTGTQPWGPNTNLVYWWEDASGNIVTSPIQVAGGDRLGNTAPGYMPGQVDVGGNPPPPLAIHIGLPTGTLTVGAKYNLVFDMREGDNLSSNQTPTWIPTKILEIPVAPMMLTAPYFGDGGINMTAIFDHRTPKYGAQTVNQIVDPVEPISDEPPPTTRVTAYTGYTRPPKPSGTATGHEYFYDGHDGTDYGMLAKTFVLAPADGTVVFSGVRGISPDTPYGDFPGWTMEIEHHIGGQVFRSLFAHLTGPLKQVGDTVKAGEIIALSGYPPPNGAAHLHYTLYMADQAVVQSFCLQGCYNYQGQVDPYGWRGFMFLRSHHGQTTAPDPWDPPSVRLWYEYPALGGHYDAEMGFPSGNPIPMPADPIENQAGAFVVEENSSDAACGSGIPWNSAAGHDGAALWTYSGSSVDCSITWNFPANAPTGEYRVYAYIPSGMTTLTLGAIYDIHNVDGTAHGYAAQARYNNHVLVPEDRQWVDLGHFRFDPSAANQSITLTDVTLDRDSQAHTTIVADAILFVPYVPPVPDQPYDPSSRGLDISGTQPPGPTCPPVSFYAHIDKWPLNLGTVQVWDKDAAPWATLYTYSYNSPEYDKTTGMLHLFDVEHNKTVNYEVRTYAAWNLSILPLTWYPIKFSNTGCPGGDTPDETHSASSYTLNLDLSDLAGTRPEPRVAVVSSGYFWAAQNLAEQAGEPTQWIGTDFDPASTVAKYPVLIIPSGGLYGMEGSPSFRARLEEYANLGGTIIALDQQHGYEYAALPGGKIGGYGWAEDISCSGASLTMSSWHPALSGFDRPNVYAFVDGYFTSWPEGTQTLLSRTANGKPGAILYQYNNKGWVFATTMYDDWGLGNGQSYDDSRVLLRDLITWAISPDDLPQHAPGDSITLDVPVTNTGTTDATSATLKLVDPARQVSDTQTVSTAIAVGDTVNVPFTTTAATPLGIWRVDADLSGDSNTQVATDIQVARYVVARPPALVSSTNPLSLSITAPDSTFAYGSTAPFVYHIYNSGDTPLTVTVMYGFDHSEYQVLQENVTVDEVGHDGRPTEVTIPFNAVVNGTFRLRGYATSGDYEAEASFGVFTNDGSVNVAASAEPSLVKYGETTNLIMTLSPLRPLGAPVNGLLSIHATDARGFLFYTYTSTEPVSISGSPDSPTTVTQEIPLPDDINPGTARIWVTVKTLEGKTLGGGGTQLTVPATPLTLSFSQIPALGGETTADIDVKVDNPSTDQPVENGTITLTLTTPDSGTTPTASKTFTAPVSSTQTVTVPLALPALKFGQYILRADTHDEYGTLYKTVTWTATPQIQATLNHPTYRAGEDASLTLKLVNPGPFVLPLTATASTEFSYTQTETLTLAPYSTQTQSFDIPIPENSLAGSYPVTLTLALLSGDALPPQEVATIQVSPSSLACAFDVSGGAQLGTPLTGTITNVGGAHGSGEYTLELRDISWKLVESVNETLPDMALDAVQPVSITVPSGTLSGEYTLTCVTRDTAANETRTSRWPVSITGVVAQLQASTDKPVYPVDEPINVTANINNTGTSLTDGRLDLRIRGRQAGWPIWSIYDTDNSSLASNSISAVAVDQGSNIWFGSGEYVDGLPRPISMLSSDLSTWTLFDTPGAVSQIAVDASNTKWFATDAGVARLDQANSPLATLTASDGLPNNQVNSVFIDPHGNVWFGTAAGVAELTSDNQWHIYTETDGLASNWVNDVVVDDEGNAWFGTDGGLTERTFDGIWNTYTTSDNILPWNDVHDLTFDPDGNLWIAASERYTENGGITVRTANGTWQHYSTSSGMASADAISVAVDTTGRAWVGYYMAGVDILMPDRTTWQHYNGGSDGVLSSQVINDFAFSPSGDVWLATEPSYIPSLSLSSPSGLSNLLHLTGLTTPIGPTNASRAGSENGGVTRAYTGSSDEQILWSYTDTINLDSSGIYPYSDYVSASSLGATGKLYLEAELTSPTGQRIAHVEQPFYIFPGDVALTFAAAPGVYRPGQSIALTGQVENTGSVTLTGRTITVTQDGATIWTDGPFALEPGGTHQINADTFAPDITGETVFTASINVDGFQVTDGVQVGLPVVTADVQVPDMAGSQSFPLEVTLTNIGPVDATIHAKILPSDTALTSYDDIPITVPAGQVYRLEKTYQITRNTDFTLTFTGDFANTITQSVGFGEAFTTDFSPDALYPEGIVAIPYTLTNTGQLAASDTVTVTIASTASSVGNTISAYLLPAQAAHGTLFLDLDEGDYTLSYVSPYGDGMSTFKVVPLEEASLTAEAGPVTNGVVTVTAHITNTGFAPIDGLVHVETPFFSGDYPVSILAGAAQTLEMPIDVSFAEGGTYTANLTLRSSSGETLTTGSASFDVPGPELVLTSNPTDTVVTAGETVTLTFGVANQGSAPATAAITTTLGDLVNETHSLWLTGGESGQIVFTFTAPAGLSGEHLTGEFWFNGERHDLSLPITGVNPEVSIAWDQASYAAGDTATLSLTVTNPSATAAPDMYAHVAYNGEFFTRPLTLGANDTQVLQFPLTVSTSADPKVFYALYETAEQRGVYLNTTYLYVSDPELSIVPDHPVYQPGQTVHVAVHTTLTGTLAISAPGFSTTLNLTGSDTDFQFTLPADTLRGTYEIAYTLDDGMTRTTPFDVDAAWVRVTEARLLGAPYAPGDHVRADLTVASTAALDVEVRSWFLYPDGTRSDPSTSSVSLGETAINRISLDQALTTSQAGPHRLVYQLVDPNNPDRIYAAGSETFDIGAAQVLGVHTDRDSYPLDTDPVTATVMIYTQEAARAHLVLLLDGTPVASRDLTLAAGVQTEAISVPEPISPADHVLTARLEVAGLEHSADVRFAYGTEVVDLTPGLLQVIETTAGTRTLRTIVYNIGQTASAASAAQIWDGAPDAGGTLIGEQTLPALTPGESAQVELSWNILGQAGQHTLTVLVDPGNQVVEYNEQNNTIAQEAAIPDFTLEVEPSTPSYDEGQPATITLTATNLTQSAVSKDITTTAETPGAEVVFSDVRSVTVPAASQASQTITWDTSQAANQTYTIHATSGAELNSNLATLVVNNVAPAVDAGPDQTGQAGEAVSFNGSFTDPGQLDTHTFAWDFGDGTTASDTLTPTHTYAANGVYTVILTVTDSDGDVGSDALTVTVASAAPVVNAGADAAITEGGTFSGTGSFTDPGENTWMATVDYGDGPGVQPLTLTDKTFTLSYTYIDNGTYTVEVCVTGDEGGSGCDALTVIVNNAAPVVQVSGPTTTQVGTIVTFEGAFTDPGTVDTHTIAWSFGDGTTLNNNLTAVHTFSAPGTYTVRLTVTDDDGGAGEQALTIQVDALAGLVVNSTGDGADSNPADSACNDGMGVCTLRAAIQQANATSGTDTINFNLPGTAPFVITPASALPDITGPVVIDGTTQPGFAATPIVRLDGTNAGADANGLTLQADSSMVRGLMIVRFSKSGIFVYGDNNAVTGSFVGTDGAIALGNTADGIAIENASGNTIGGTEAGAGNLVSGNGRNGISINGTDAGGNIIRGNRLGTDAAGTLVIGNTFEGIYINGASGNTIGGTEAGAGNLVSGNRIGIYLIGTGASGNVIQGNKTGTNTSGTLAIGNTGSGIYINNAPNNTIGGTAAGAGNLSSGNGSNGITLNGADATGNIVQGNKLGTDITGTLDLGNTGTGIYVYHAPGNTVTGNLASGNNSTGLYIYGSGAGVNLIQGNRIGTDITGAVALGNTTDGITVNSAPNNTIDGNLISGNRIGLYIYGTSAAGNTVRGNKIGTNLSGTLALGNAWDAIFISDAPGNIIGGTAAGEGNLLSGNGDDGIEIRGAGATGNIVRGNKVGTDITGTLDLGNVNDGITIYDASGNTIGGTAAGAGNLASGNDDDGISIVLATSTGNIVQGNKAGTDITGTLAIGNTWDGIYIDNAANNTIGGTAAGAGNLLSGNHVSGISIEGTGANGNIVQGNKVGTNATGTLAIPNIVDGIAIYDGANNVIGGTAVGAGNLSSGNTIDGIYITGATASGNIVQGNKLGTDITGTLDLGNVDDGIYIYNAPNNTVGGTAAGAGNLISGNNNNGVGIEGTSASGNIVQGNLIGTDVTGTLALGNTWNGIGIYGAPSNTIGGAGAGAGNLSSGNAANGIGINYAGASGNIVQGNKLGTDITGTLAIPNAYNGVGIYGSPNNTIGGTAAGAGNLTSGNTADGIYVSGTGASGTIIQGNKVGTDITGTLDLGNTAGGIYLSNAVNTTVGGTTATSSNVILGNGAGVAITGSSAAGNSVRGNSISSNDGLGIDLGATGVTANDTGDGDTGPNGLQNFPVVTSARSNASQTTVIGTLNSKGSKTYTLDFYANPTCDASGSGEGKVYLGSGQATTNSSGNASFTLNLSTSATVGWVVTATATDPTGNTSEFSACRTVTALTATITLPPLAGTSPAPVSGTAVTAVSLPTWYWRYRIEAPYSI